MPGPVLYSVNPLLKFQFCEKYVGGVHWIWCSEAFDGKAAGSLSPHASIGPSSNPKDLYRRLKEDTDSGDKGSAMIAQKRAKLIETVGIWYAAKQIDDAQRKEALATIELVDARQWRPILYVIPRAPLGTRLNVVPPEERASAMGCEFRIFDLRTEEFDAIELY